MKNTENQNIEESYIEYQARQRREKILNDLKEDSNLVINSKIDKTNEENSED